jgi:flavin reductase (DIM6/NTAB) family NADH-FMN oxidoreductase RutF
MKTLFGPQRLTIPFPTVLVVTGNMDNANIITIAWISMLTGTPPTLGISIGSKGYSGEQIMQHKDFSVNLASVNIMTEADYCGITSGLDTNKFEDTGFTKLAARMISSPIIKECPVNIECQLVESHKVGKTNHFIGEIVETHIDTDKLEDTSKHGSLRPDLVDPLLYFSGVREYWGLGKKVGNAYKVGRNLKK